MNGKLVVASVPKPPITLEELLFDINEHNLHRNVSVAPDGEKEE